MGGENVKNKKVIGIIVVIVIVVVGFIFWYSKGKSKSGITVNQDQTLHVKGSNIDYSLKVESIDQVEESDFMEKTTYTRLKVSITNNANSKNTGFFYTTFVALDSKENELTSTNLSMNGLLVEDQSTILPTDLEAKQTISGYVYLKTESKDISKIKILVPTNISTDDGNEYKIERDEYFINIK